MASPFHEGELAVQARAGVREAAARLTGMLRRELSPQAAAFVEAQELVLAGAADADGRVWASAIPGEPGMLRVPGPDVLEIAAAPAVGDPLRDVLYAARGEGASIPVGVLAIDLLTRKRLRVNGRTGGEAGGALLVHVDQAYWNCPKYIQVRRMAPCDPDGFGNAPAASPRQPSAVLGEAQRAWIAGADTFFIATAHPRAGTDVSHRGGEPGFVQLARSAEGGDVLLFPDYSGNNLFNTLGNLEANPAAGIVFVDFERGATLQLTGRARVLWDRAEFACFPGAERAVRFEVSAAVQVDGAVPRRWDLLLRSPFNPPAPASPCGTP